MTVIETGQADDHHITKVLSLATSQKYDRSPSQNLASYVLEGSLAERRLAIETIGLFRMLSLIPVLDELLTRCRAALNRRSEIVDGRIHGYELQLASDVCLTLARLDCEITHQTLMNMCLT